MIKWLWEVLFCWHDWEDIGSGVVKNRYNQVTGFYEKQRCRKCKRLRIEEYK